MPCKEVQPLSRIKTITLNGSRVRGISPVGKENVYRGKDLLKSQVLSSEWKTERVREDAGGDSEDIQWCITGFRLLCCALFTWFGKLIIWSI